MPYPNPHEMRTEMGRARNLGSAKTGVHHWLSVKVTSVALIPLTLWFIWVLLARIIPHATSFEFMLDWMKKPYNSFPLILLLWVNFYHAYLGGQEIIIDYVHDRKYQIPSLIAYKFFCYGAAAISIYTVLYITFRM